MPQSNTNKVGLESLFKRRPDEAIKYLQDKKPQASIDYLEVKGRAHDHAFVIAKMTDMDMLSTMQKSLITAMEDNMSFEDWQATVKPMLKKKGWWGKQDITLPDGSVKPAQLGSDYRLQRIYDTNINQAYHKARRHDGDFDIYPYAMWQSRGDNRVRPSHQSLDGQIFRRDDPYYQSIRPRVAWGCRCDEILLTSEQAGAYGAQDGYMIHEDISEYVTTENVIVQGMNGAYTAPINVLRLPDMPVYRTDPGWIHAKDALPMQPMLSHAADTNAMLASTMMQAVFARESVVNRFNNDVKSWIYSSDVPAADYRHVGALMPDMMTQLIEKGMDNAVVTLGADMRMSNQSWLANIVRHLTNGYQTYWDDAASRALLVFDDRGRQVVLSLGKDGAVVAVETVTARELVNRNLERLDATP